MGFGNQSDKQGPMRKGSSDDFQTPKEALYPLIPFLQKEWTIWEPASGEGNLVRELERLHFNVVYSDLNETDFPMTRMHDFLSWTPEKFDCIITNPPYSLKQEFLERCYQLKKPFALLLPLTTFETPKRQQLFRDNGLQVLFFDRRINFTTPSKGGRGAWFATAWFTWGLNLPRELNFVKFKGIGQQTIDI